MIVEDSRSIRGILVGALRGQNLFDHYLEAPNGRIGLEIAAEQCVDVVLCDLDGVVWLAQQPIPSALTSMPLSPSRR